MKALKHFFQFRNYGGFNGNQVLDTLSLTRSMEAQGMPSKQTEAVVTAMRNGLVKLRNAEIKELEILRDSHLTKFRSEHLSSQQDYALKAKFEAGKYDVLKYGIASLGSMFALGIAILHYM